MSQISSSAFVWLIQFSWCVLHCIFNLRYRFISNVIAKSNSNMVSEWGKKSILLHLCNWVSKLESVFIVWKIFSSSSDCVAICFQFQNWNSGSLFGKFFFIFRLCLYVFSVLFFKLLYQLIVETSSVHVQCLGLLVLIMIVVRGSSKMVRKWGCFSMIVLYCGILIVIKYGSSRWCIYQLFNKRPLLTVQYWNFIGGLCCLYSTETSLVLHPPFFLKVTRFNLCLIPSNQVLIFLLTLL